MPVGQTGHENCPKRAELELPKTEAVRVRVRVRACLRLELAGDSLVLDRTTRQRPALPAGTLGR
jgi:hypothetical protein